MHSIWPRGVMVSTVDSESSSRGPHPREAFQEDHFQGSHVVLHEILPNKRRENPNEPMHLKAHAMRQTWDHQRYSKQSSSLRSLPQEGAPHPPGGTGICMNAAMICESCCATLLCQRCWGPPPTTRTGDQEKQTDQSAPPAPSQPTHVGTKRGARSGSPPALPKGSRGAFRSKSAGEKKAETRGSFFFSWAKSGKHVKPERR